MNDSHGNAGGGLSGSMGRTLHKEDAEFDITAMIDLVFMMNIYFLVTFITVALGEIDLPSAHHAAPLDPETAVPLTVMASADGQSSVVYLGNGAKGEALSDPEEQERRVQETVEQGVGAGKTAVVIKAESKVKLREISRISNAASAEGVTLHVAVMEKDLGP